MKRENVSVRNNPKEKTARCVIHRTVSSSLDIRSQDFAVKCSELFATGADTIEIARMLKATEAQVYNAMARLGQ